MGSRAAVSLLPVRRWIERRDVVLVAAAALFIVVFALCHTGPEVGEGIALLYVVPIALVALELGLVAGICASALALGLVGVWALDSHTELDAVGFLTRGVAYVAVGVLAGRFSDRMRDAHAREELLLESGLTLAHLDVSDDLPATVAQQAQRLASTDVARVELSSNGTAEADSAGDDDGWEERFPIELGGTSYGTLIVLRSRPFMPEDHATLAILALQAAGAAESRRLLESERERAVIRAELQEARGHLAERGGQLREVIQRQEAERHHVAYELREQSAQTLAAVLLGLGALERQLGSGLAEPRLGELRSDIGCTLRSLRSLAASMRPPLELGLRTALEGLAARSRDGPAFAELTIALPERRSLNAEVETIIYRVAEEALAAVGGARLLAVRAQADGSELAIDVQGAHRGIQPERLAVLRARIELVGGTLVAHDTALRAVIPLPSGPPRDSARETSSGIALRTGSSGRPSV